MQAAIGRIQYRRLPQWHQQRTENANTLRELLEVIPGLRVPEPEPGLTHAYYRLYAYVDSACLLSGWNRDRIIGEVNRVSPLPISTGSSAEIYREFAFKQAGLAQAAPLPRASRACRESLAFVVHPGLKFADLDGVARSIASVMAAAVNAG